MKKIVVEMHHSQATALIAIMLVLFAVNFLVGYFWGKKSALEEFAEQIKNESFSDKVYASLCALYEQPTDAESNTVAAPLADSVEEPSQGDSDDNEIVPAKNTSLFVAQLIGYGTEKQAQLYVKALGQRGIPAEVVKRTSITAGGKKRVWYQVVSQAASYENTQKLAERLAIEDRLAGVSIIEIVN
ncbi:MAG: hypothetical protein K2X90_03735 [Candidatus Babeliaceae bacterium]|nr:hypothetical protein [Candidatus Babeliaceae bacterium]